MTKLFQIYTLGCRTNQYESQGFRNQLQAMGYTSTDVSENADICIVNTCTVTESAHKQSIHDVKKLVQRGIKVVVTGCAAEKSPEQFPGAIVVGNEHKEKLLETVFPDLEIPEFKINNFEAHTRAFVKVQDGCNSFCTYCIIPYVRGRSRSRPLEDIIKEVEALVANGYKEVVLTGINIGDFTPSLTELVRAVDKVEGLKRLRLSSIDPDEVGPDLQEALLTGKNTCPSLHLVLQSGSNVILKRMNRKYTRQIFRETVERLIKTSPDFTFTTDVIVGFPGETEEDHKETLDLIKEVSFAKVHMFPYSEREGTRAVLFPGKVPPAIISRRKGEIMQAAEKAAYALRERYVGRRMVILTENGEGGHTENFLSVLFKAEPNQEIPVILTKNGPKGLSCALV
ncbi:MAG: tRNA (N(6)-L-threonylcarbamoyladenosine(37)-C(2))-methylthiotransferase MtaB [Chlamydiae bacterium]|nr:tRNA (N(6)-L-threonylcarbamoyladenosine(37)-C(2))-methylthiotransferase MtaB [Chlamydiota bacterium]